MPRDLKRTKNFKQMGHALFIATIIALIIIASVLVTLAVLSANESCSPSPPPYSAQARISSAVRSSGPTGPPNLFSAQLGDPVTDAGDGSDGSGDNGDDGNSGNGGNGGTQADGSYSMDYYAGHDGNPSYAANGDAGESCQPSQEPASYFQYGKHAGATYDAGYATAEDHAGQFAEGCGAAGASSGYELNIDSLMPASWKGTKNCGDASASNAQWAKYAPTKEAFDKYISVMGSARLSMNTRSPLARQVGMPLLIRQSPPVPVSARDYAWGDSSFRQDLVFRQTGRFPVSVGC